MHGRHSSRDRGVSIRFVRGPFSRPGPRLARPAPGGRNLRVGRDGFCVGLRPGEKAVASGAIAFSAPRPAWVRLDGAGSTNCPTSDIFRRRAPHFHRCPSAPHRRISASPAPIPPALRPGASAAPCGHWRAVPTPPRRPASPGAAAPAPAPSPRQDRVALGHSAHVGVVRSAPQAPPGVAVGAKQPAGAGGTEAGTATGALPGGLHRPAALGGRLPGGLGPHRLGALGAVVRLRASGRYAPESEATSHTPEGPKRPAGGHCAAARRLARHRRIQPAITSRRRAGLQAAHHTGRRPRSAAGPAGFPQPLHGSGGLTLPPQSTPPARQPG